MAANKKTAAVTVCAAAAALVICGVTDANLRSVEPAVPAAVISEEYTVIQRQEDISALSESDTDMGLLDINMATAEELEEIDGIGPAAARSIVAYRNEKGFICSLEELLEINGIGEGKLKAISERVFISDDVLQQTVSVVTGAVTETEWEELTSSESITETESEATVPEALWVNINTADKEELSRLEGIGSATADKIIRYRNDNGSFCSVDELINVSGIGEKKLEALRPFVYVDAPLTEAAVSESVTEIISESITESSVGEETAAEAASQKEIGLININTASAAELTALDGVGEAIAERIVEYRSTYGSFSSTEEIMNVKGIGEKKYEAFKEMICV